MGASTVSMVGVGDHEAGSAALTAGAEAKAQRRCQLLTTVEEAEGSITT